MAGLRFNREYIGEHFRRHGKGFPGIQNEDEYEARANALIEADRDSIMECVRKDGDTMKYDPVTCELAIYTENDVIRTYLKCSYNQARVLFDMECD